MRRLVHAFMLVAVLAFATHAFADTQYVIDGGFESGTSSNWTVTTIPPATYAVQTAISQTGNYAFMIDMPPSGTVESVYISQMFPTAVTNNPFSFSFGVYAHNPDPADWIVISYLGIPLPQLIGVMNSFTDNSWFTYGTNGYSSVPYPVTGLLIGVQGPNNTGQPSQFYLDNISVIYPPLPLVPEPTTAWYLMSALSGLAIAGRKFGVRRSCRSI